AIEEIPMRGRSWLVQSLVGMAVLAVLVSGARAQLLSPSTKPAAVVDGTAITMAEGGSILKQTRPTATPLTEAQRKQLQMEAVSVLIDDVLMEQFLRKNGPRIDAAEVNKKVAELQASLKQQGKNLADFFRESGQSEAQLRVNILNMLQWAAY